MPTYAENAKRQEIQARRRAQDRAEAERHRAFDLSAQDRHMKYERAHFAVVMASDAYREGWQRIFGGPDA